MMTHIEGYEWQDGKIQHFVRNIGGWMNTVSTIVFISAKTAYTIFDGNPPSINKLTNLDSRDKLNRRPLKWRGSSMTIGEHRSSPTKQNERAKFTITRIPDPNAHLRTKFT